MKNIGFFVGRENFLNHARALHKSIINNTFLAQEYQIFMMTPDYLNSAMDIPGVNHLKFEVPEIYRSLPFIDKMFAAAAFENNCPEGYIWLDVDLHNCNPTPISLEDLISIRYDDYFDSNSVPLIWANEFNDIRDGLKSNWYY